MIEEQLDLLDQITHEVSNLKFEIEFNNPSSNHIQWTVSNIHELLDKLLLTEQK